MLSYVCYHSFSSFLFNCVKSAEIFLDKHRIGYKLTPFTSTYLNNVNTVEKIFERRRLLTRNLLFWQYSGIYFRNADPVTELPFLG